MAGKIPVCFYKFWYVATGASDDRGGTIGHKKKFTINKVAKTNVKLPVFIAKKAGKL